MPAHIKPSPTLNPGQPVPEHSPYVANPPTFVYNAEPVPGPAGMPQHACMGLNSCRGSDRFGLAGAPGLGPNSCAGQGYCATADVHQCKVQNGCRNQGGCGLYGTDEDQNQPGVNACRSLGTCATPINAERFSTDGPNKGKSVWVRAREVFEQQVWPDLRRELLAKQESGEIHASQPLPETLGPVPAPFAETGPTYLWISEVNHTRSNMTACGQSGLSGAGGCA